ncbi:hypothetical protein IJJ27_02860 [bacterium]|nr:hypothetical protein [bacterium]
MSKVIANAQQRASSGQQANFSWSLTNEKLASFLLEAEDYYRESDDNRALSSGSQRK